MGNTPLLYILAWAVAGLAVARMRNQEGEDFRTQPRDEWPKQQAAPAPSPYILYGPHGYKTFPHSRCLAFQESFKGGCFKEVSRRFKEVSRVIKKVSREGVSKK